LTRPVSKENYKEAVGLFETALTLDPQATDAAAWLAIALVVRVTDEVSDSPDADLLTSGAIGGASLGRGAGQRAGA
jgi:hypothetical protein